MACKMCDSDYSTQAATLNSAISSVVTCKNREFLSTHTVSSAEEGELGCTTELLNYLPETASIPNHFFGKSLDA